MGLGEFSCVLLQTHATQRLILSTEFIGKRFLLITRFYLQHSILILNATELL